MIENARNLGDVLDYCIENNIEKRTFIHETCSMKCDYPIEKELANGIREAVKNGPRYRKARDGSIWKIEQYNYIGTGRYDGYECHGFSVEKIIIE